MRYFIAVIAIIGILTIDGCGKHSRPSIIERTDSDGVVSVEIPTEQTYPEDELPAGIERHDVAAVITLTDDSGETESELAPGPGEPAGTYDGMVAQVKKALKPKARKPTKQDNQLFVMKDGRVLAGREAAAKIDSAEKVERSWTWLWWVIGVLAVLMGSAWAVDKFVKPISFIARLFFWRK